MQTLQTVRLSFMFSSFFNISPQCLQDHIAKVYPQCRVKKVFRKSFLINCPRSLKVKRKEKKRGPRFQVPLPLYKNNTTAIAIDSLYFAAYIRFDIPLNCTVLASSNCLLTALVSLLRAKREWSNNIYTCLLAKP